MRNSILFITTLATAVIISIAAAERKAAPPKPVLPVPTDKQLAWHEMEFNAFIHFTTNTFTDLEWGNGDESPAIFKPTQFNPSQWASVLKQAGCKGVILTAKHHDGFCLWPSKYTEHSVKNSPWLNGKGDVVKATRDAVKKEGLKFGIYVSPWDRNHAEYGRPGYITYYRNQLKELFTSYGPFFEMWFDGANGGNGYYGGANETRRINGATYYNWPTTIDMVRGIQPGILFFSDAGPSIRWVGNERGVAGATNWNTISNDTLYAGKPNIEELLNRGSEDGTKWIPAEVDVSIRPGWFYHAKEDSLVKSPERLFEIYLTSIGRGSTLLLNVPPDRRGLIHENDVQSLQGFQQLLKKEFAVNLAKGKKVTVSAVRGNDKQFDGACLVDGKKDTYWATNDEVTNGTIEIDLSKPTTVKYILVQEYIKLGQRVKSFSVDVWKDNAWKPVASATTIGYKRILKIDPVETNKVRITIADSKACPVISNVEIY